MKKMFTLVLITLFTANIYSQMNYEKIAEHNEIDAANLKQALIKSQELNLPSYIICENHVKYEIVGIKNGAIIYANITNFAKPNEGAELLNWSEVQGRLETHKIVVQGHSDGKQIGNLKDLVHNTNSGKAWGTDIFLIPQSNSESIMAFDAETGDLIHMGFNSSDPTNMSTPIKVLPDINGDLLISDQLEDLVFKYETTGDLINNFAPMSGVQNDTLDNVRGFWVDESYNVYVTTASGPNKDAIALFDPQGQGLGNFIEPNETILDSPFDIIQRSDDFLVSAFTTDNVVKYDLSGNFVEEFAADMNAAEQIYEAENGDIYIAGFSNPSGIYVYSSDGTLQDVIDVIAGVRGVQMLGNGNLIVTNGGGVHEVDPANNTVVRTIVDGISSRMISKVNMTDLNLPLAEITVEGDVTIICPGDSVAFIAPSFGNLSNKWLKDGDTVDFASDDTLWVKEAGSYQAVLYYYDVYADTSAAVDMDIVSFTIDQNGYILSVPEGETSYQWYQDGTAISEATSNTYEVTANGEYWVNVVTADGCSVNSDTVDITDIGIQNSAKQNSLMIKPNPSDGKIQITTGNAYSGAVQVEVYDLTGRNVFTKTIERKGNEMIDLDLSGIHAGIYTLSINKKSTRKLVIY